MLRVPTGSRAGLIWSFTGGEMPTLSETLSRPLAPLWSGLRTALAWLSKSPVSSVYPLSLAG